MSSLTPESHMFKGGIVAANFDADMRKWGQIDTDTITEKITPESMVDAMERAGLNFVPLGVQGTVKNPIDDKVLEMRHKAIINPVTNEIIGEVGKDFNAKSHYDTLSSVLGVIMDEKGFIPSRFVNLGGGARMIAQFFIPHEYRGGNRDHKCFASMYNGLDGTTSVRGGLSIWSPACTNTLAKMKADLSEGVRHTVNMDINLDRVRKAMGLIEKEAMSTMGLFDNAYGKEANTETVKEFLNHMTPISKNKASENRQAELSKAITETQMEVMTEVKITGTGGFIMPAVTFYDLLAGATRYTSGHAQNRDSNEQFESVLDGSGDKFNQKAVAWVTTNL